MKKQPGSEKAKGNGISELFHYGDKLFSTSTAAVDHVVYAGASSKSPGTAKALESDLNLEDNSVGDTASHNEGLIRRKQGMIGCFIDLSYSMGSPASSRGSSRTRWKSIGTAIPGTSKRRPTQRQLVIETLEAAKKSIASNSTPLVEQYLPMVEALQAKDEALAYYSAKLLAQKPKL